MPYEGPDDKNLPDHVKELDPKLRAQWVEIWNSVFDRTGDEGEATRQANGVIARRRNEMAEIVVFPIAKLDTAKYGKVDFGDEFATKILENFENKVLKIDPVIDAEHKEGKAMGWIKRLFRSTFKDLKGKDKPCVKAEVDWTEEGSGSIERKEFKYFSPVINSYKDEETGKRYYPVLTGGALTNTPVLKLMPEVALSEEGGEMKVPIEIPLYLEEEGPDPGASLRKAIEAIDAFLSEGDGAIKNKRGAPVARTILREARAKLSRYLPKEMGGDGKDMDERSETMELKEIAEALGLEFSEDASDEDIKAKLKEFSEAHSKAEKELDEAKAEIEDLKKGSGDKEKELAELTKRLTEVEKNLVLKEGWYTITQAMSEGKIMPSQAGLWAERFLADPANTKPLIDSLAPVVDLGDEKGSEGKGAETGAFMAEVKRVQDEKEISFSEAMDIVQRDKPELAEQYKEEVRK